MHTDGVVPWTMKQSNNKSSWDHRSPASPRLGDWQWLVRQVTDVRSTWWCKHCPENTISPFISILINSLLIISGLMSLKQSNEQLDYMYFLLMAPCSWNMARQQHVKCNSLGSELGGQWHDPDRCCGQHFSRKMSRAARHRQAERGSPQHSRKYFQSVWKIFNAIYIHIWSEYKATIAGIRTYRNILIKILLTSGRQPINEWPQITWHPCDSPMCPTFLS